MAMYSGEKAFSINCFMLVRYSYGKICSSQVVLVVNNSPANAGRCRRHEFNSWVKEIPWRRKWQPTLVFLPGKSHGQRSLASCSLWDRRRVRHNWVTEHACTLLSRQSFQLLLSSPTLNLILASLEGLESSGSNQSTCFPTLICWSNTKGPSSQSQLPHPFPLLLSSPKPWVLAFQPPNFSVPTRGLQNDTGDNATICRSVALNIHASIVS